MATISKQVCDTWSEAYSLRDRLIAAGIKVWISQDQRSGQISVKALGNRAEIGKALDFSR